MIWGLHWEHGSLWCAILRTLSLQTSTGGWALSCNCNTIMFCDSPVVLCCRRVMMFCWNVSTYLPHYTVTSQNSHVSFNISHLPRNLLPPSSGTCVLCPVYRTLHWAHVPEDRGSKFLLKMHYSKSYFVCLQIGRTQGQLRMISHCRGFVCGVPQKLHISR